MHIYKHSYIYTHVKYLCTYGISETRFVVCRLDVKAKISLPVQIPIRTYSQYIRSCKHIFIHTYRRVHSNNFRYNRHMYIYI